MPGQADLDVLARMLMAFRIERDLVWPGTIPGRPWTKKRPRFTSQGHAYQDPADKAAEASTGWALRKSFRTPLRGNLAMACVLYVPDSRWLDVDNMMKHILDAGNKVAWADDGQFTALAGVAELDRGNPRTELMVARHNSTLQR